MDLETGMGIGPPRHMNIKILNCIDLGILWQFFEMKKYLT